jgi:protein-S-isoprenylcysteine O-methyltransferase Ste14
MTGRFIMGAVKLKIPPPIVTVAMGIVMWLIARFTPAFALAFPARHVVAVCIALAGVVIAVMGIASFRRAGTTVNPLQPQRASSLVTGGIYQVTRNPMYLGLLLALIAWGMLLANALALIILPVFIVYMNCFQIRAEEAALTAAFGQDFVDYKSRVRRWL